MNVQRGRHVLLRPLWRRALELGQVRQPALTHIWPVIFIATFGGLAYNMRVMRANLLDVLNSAICRNRARQGPAREVR
jgi:ABC-type dipeptide/oligopeptide/nickel transport system permease component